MATACLMNLLDKNIDMLIINDPTTPDRTKYIIDNTSPNPTDNILSMIDKLKKYNVDIIGMPCNTASYFYEKVKDNINCEFVSIVEETVKLINNLNIKTVGLLATDGTINSEIYKKELDKYGIKILLPNKDNQKNVMDIIYNEVKANKKVSQDKLEMAISDLKNQGAQKIILGCTELSVIYENELIKDNTLVDSIKVLSNEINKRAKN